MASNIELKYKSWSTLPIGKYDQIKDIIASECENPDIEILAVLCDCNVDDILNAPVGVVKKLLAQGSFLSEKMNIQDKLKHKNILIDGVKYVVHTDFKEITTAQYIDFQTFYKDFDKNYCNVLACFIIPEGHKYNDGYDALEVAEIFRRKMPVEVAENACFFFACRSSRFLDKGLRQMVWTTSMMEVKERDKETKKQITEMKNLLVKQRDDIYGLERLMRSLVRKG